MTQALRRRTRPHRRRTRLILAAAILAAAGQTIVHHGGARPLHDPAITAPSARLLHVQQAPSLGLAVALEHRCAPYRRSDYTYSQAVEARIIATMGGRIYGPYTGRFFTNRRQTDIEHIVALSEDHDSGLCAADAALKHRFAADLLNLTLAAPAVNRCGPSGKCAKDAGEWLPPMNQCWFAARVVAVKRKYRLSVDPREAATLESVLSACTTIVMILPDRAAGHSAPAGGATERNAPSTTLAAVRTANAVLNTPPRNRKAGKGRDARARERVSPSGGVRHHAIGDDRCSIPFPYSTIKRPSPAPATASPRLSQPDSPNLFPSQPRYSSPKSGSPST